MATRPLDNLWKSFFGNAEVKEQILKEDLSKYGPSSSSESSDFVGPMPTKEQAAHAVEKREQEAMNDILSSVLSEESSAYDQYVALQDRWNKETRDWNERQAEIDRQFQASSAEQAMKFSADEAQKNRDWQEQMSNTAYQRAVKDLREAGLNPILAYSQGGASIGSGSQGTGYTASGSSASSATPSASKRQVSSDVLSQMYIAASQNATKISAANIALQGALASAAASRYSADKSYAAAQTRNVTELLSSVVASLVRLA